MRLSVIIPGYNNPDNFWVRCVKSVLRNLTNDDEIICVDDGSARKPSVLAELRQIDKRVKVIYAEKNGGLSVARNIGMAAATGQFVSFVDSDDELVDGIYTEVLEAVETTRSDIGVFGVKSIWLEEGVYKINLPPPRNFGILQPEDIVCLYQARVFNYAWNKIYRRAFLDSALLTFNPDGMPCEDVIFNLEAIIAHAKWVGVAKVGSIDNRSYTTLLSKYKKSYGKGIEICNVTWRKYKRAGSEVASVLGDIGEMSESALREGEWDNIWRPGSPYTLLARLSFAKERPELNCGHPYCLFIKKALYTLARRILYIKPLRRRHILKEYPDARNVEVDN